MSDFTDSRTELDHKGRVVKVMDFRLQVWPAVWTVCGLIGFLAWSAITIWFQVQQLNTSVTNLQVLITSGNNSLSAISSDVTLLKFRESNLEDVVKHNSSAIEGLRK